MIGVEVKPERGSRAVCDPCGYRGSWKERRCDARGALVQHESSGKHRQAVGARRVRLPAC